MSSTHGLPLGGEGQPSAKPSHPTIAYPSLPAADPPRENHSTPARPKPTIQPVYHAAQQAPSPRSPLASPSARSPGGIKSPLNPTAQRGIPNAPAQPALRRTTSSTSLRSSGSKTPTLLKKSSMTSLREGGTNTPPRSPASRRTSSNMGTGYAPLPSPRKSLTPALEEEPPKSAPSQAEVAKTIFEKELKLQEESQVYTDLLVVLHDACFGHRFSRPRTSKAALNTIVERPERITAIIEGLSMAYVRLGGRHIDGAYPLHPQNPMAAPPFKFKKSTRFLPLEHPAVTQVHGVEWMKELKIMCEGAEARLALDGKELTRPTQLHNGASTAKKPQLHEGDLYLCAESLDALQGALGGVCDAVDAVFEPSGSRRAFACVRPPGHHCSNDHPSGFCWLNNVHVGIAHAMQSHGLTHAAIIDFDLHHGDGSQAITWAHNSRINSMHKNTPLAKRPPIGYFSLHDINSYPCEWGDMEKVQNASLCIENAHGQTVWNVHLQTWRTEAEFWKLYETRYTILLEKMRDFLRNHSEKLQSARSASNGKANGRVTEIPAPKAAIFVSAGFDASEYEGQGMQRHKVNVPTDFYARFTRDISRLANEEDLGVEGRIVSVLEGGYSDRALTTGVFSHVCGLADSGQPNKEAETDLADRMTGLSVDETGKKAVGDLTATDHGWWSSSRMDEFEEAKRHADDPVQTGAEPKKGRNFNPTYFTPTQASVAKSLPPRRSLPGQRHQQPAPAPAPPPRPPTPPPPPVEWTASAIALSRLLIPSDRQTLSCKPEDLAAPRQRKARQSDIGVLSIPDATEADTGTTTFEGKRTGLRERKTKPIYTSDHEEEKPKKSRPSSRTTRRRTIGGAKSITPVEETAPVPPLPQIPVITTIQAPAEGIPEVSGSGTSSSGPHPTKLPLPIQRTQSANGVYHGHKEDESATNGSIVLEKTEDDDTEGIDGLAGQIKKMSIKLRVPSREEHEARERERELNRMRQSLS